VAVVVEEQVEFRRTLGGTELRPVEHGGTEFDDGAALASRVCF
jgi:hypothetical protein